jgi:hypothetical protein
MTIKNNQSLFYKAYCHATELPIVINVMTIGKDLFDIEMTNIQSRKVLEWYFNNYVENIPKDSWDSQTLVKVIEEFVNNYSDNTSEKLTKKKASK